MARVPRSRGADAAAREALIAAAKARLAAGALDDPAVFEAVARRLLG